MSKLKILYFDFHLPYLLKDIDYPIGGATVEWLSWIKGFNENQADVGVLTWKGASKYVNRRLQFDLVESYALDTGIPRIRFLYYRLPSIFKAIRNYKPDAVVQEAASVETGILAIMAKFLKKPFIYRVASDVDVDERIRSILSKGECAVYKLGLRTAQLICCQNTYQMRTLKEKYPNKYLLQLYNPAFCFKDIKLPDKKRQSYVAWIGIFKESKNLPKLLWIVNCLPDVNFRIAGRLTKTRIDKGTIEAVKALKSCKNVMFVGYLKRSEITKFLAEAYALLNTSVYEGFTNTFLEAWSVGTPVITTKYVNPDNLISKYGLGFVARCYSEIPTLIKELITSQKYNDFFDNCRNYVEQHHDPQVLSSKFIQAIQGLKRSR